MNGTSLTEAAKNVIKHVRFPLLDTEILTRSDDDNKVKGYIPVSYVVLLFATVCTVHTYLCR